MSHLARRWRDPEPAPLAGAAASLHRQGCPVLDLVTANPHEHGISFPASELRAIMLEAAERIAVYQPDAMGHGRAREAVAAWYARRGAPADPARILLTPGTSQAYFYALRLLADAGDEILVPSPGYPLFDDLAAIAGVRLRRYHLRRERGQWSIDPDEVDFQCTPRTRALMVVSPHNPTGLMPGAGDWEALAAICRRRGLALVVDEVFCETLARGGRYERPAVEAFPLVLTLNGLSKMLSLPGWKVGWMKVDGAPECVAPLLEALDHLNDTFLPLPDLQQAMIPALLDAGERGWFAHLAEIISRRREAALRCLEASGFVADACPAGVYLCVQLDEAPDRGSAAPDEGFALRALLEAGVLVHPGSYYSLPSHWVMTCITGEDRLEDGIRRLAGMRPG